MGYKTISERFVEGLSKELIQIGAKETTSKLISPNREFELDTIVGKLTIMVDASVDNTFAMFTRFENVEEAKKIFNCNPHSGKYNSFVGRRKGVTPEMAIKDLMLVINYTQPKKVEFDDIEVGKTYMKISHQFNNAKNRITCVSDDDTGLKRPIKYFCFTDRISKVPTQKEFIAALSDDATTIPRNPTKVQYDKAMRALEIRRNTFAMWDFEVKGTEGFAPSTSILSL